MKIKTLVLVLIVLIVAMALSGCTGKAEQKPIVTETNVYPDIDSAFETGKPVVVYFYESFVQTAKTSSP
ncbi:MAG: hypothetical protein GQ533_11965 [Methanosarcinaceae archaeon]|nr:hypothetical protein [Methanosarcinaceae archaeon]